MELSEKNPELGFVTVERCQHCGYDLGTVTGGKISGQAVKESEDLLDEVHFTKRSLKEEHNQR